MIQNYDSEIERRGHPENFLADSVLEAEEEREVLEAEGYGSQKDCDESNE